MRCLRFAAGLAAPGRVACSVTAVLAGASRLGCRPRTKCWSRGGSCRLLLLRPSRSGRPARLHLTAAQATEQKEEELLKPSAVEEPGAAVVGAYEAMQSQEALPLRRPLTAVAALGAAEGPAMGETVWVRARVATVRVKGKTTFLVLRQHSLHTVQAVKFQSKEDAGESAKQVAKFFKAMPLESIVDVRGVLVEASVKGCTQSNVELQILQAYRLSAASATLPFLMADAQRTELEVQESLKTARPYVRVLPDLRLDNRWLDLRVPANNAILRLQSAVSGFYREALTARGFIEIHSPKLLAGESEGGAEVFRTDYFGRPASLAQSPQLYKQMAISADLPGVFEVGPVFRAENSNTNRHLCEFTGLDLEMPIDWHYREVIAVVHATLIDVFERLEKDHAALLSVVRAAFPSAAPRLPPKGAPCVVPWGEAMELLAQPGHEEEPQAGSARRDPLADLSTEEEKTLGKLVLEKYGTELFFLDRYPSKVRPFYTMPCAEEPEFSNSYDVIFRGQEIGSGAQRCHDVALLEARCAELQVPLEPLRAYIDSFRHGVPPHGGVGLGLERIVQLYLGLDNIRKAVMFTRDPIRLTP